MISRYKLLEKTLEPEPPYILVTLFNMCLKEYCFQIVGRFHLWSLYLRISGKDLQNYHLVSLLSFEKFANNKLIDNLKKYGLFIYFGVSGLLNQMQIFGQFVSFNRCRARHTGFNFTISSYMGFCVSSIQVIFPFPQL